MKVLQVEGGDDDDDDTSYDDDDDDDCSYLSQCQVMVAP